MRICSFILMVCSVSMVRAQTNTFPDTGNAGIGTTTPSVPLHLVPNGSTPPWIALDKNSGMETGLQFRKGGVIQFYLYTDNVDNDALKIQSNMLTGENDDFPRVLIPYNNKDLYLALSGGNVAIGHRTPYSNSRLHLKASINSPWSFISESSTNDRIIGVSHDGTSGMISTSYLGSGGHSPIRFRTNNLSRLTIDVDGDIGVGTTEPSARFQVKQASASWDAGIRLSLMNRNWDIVADTDGDRLIISKNQSMANALVMYNGNIGIGSGFPNSKLTVNGTIYGKEVKVDLSVPAPDYVFDKDYDLLSLAELKAYVETHKHLPDVPSAKKMEESGINVSEMNMILLKKVEELTLYILDQEKRIAELEDKNETK